MAGLRFEWDIRKNRANHRKHGVTFEEAETVFLDDHALLIDDPAHSDEEDRFVLLGLSSTLRALVVCHCYRHGGDVIKDHFRARGRSVGASTLLTRNPDMRKHYDFSKAKRNPYARRLKQQVTIRLDRDTIGYFKNLSDETGIRYQTLINLYLRECAFSGKRLSIAWRQPAEKSAA